VREVGRFGLVSTVLGKNGGRKFVRCDEPGFATRFGPGLPRVSDGSPLFLLHLVKKMRPAMKGRRSTRRHGTQRITSVRRRHRLWRTRHPEVPLTKYFRSMEFLAA